HPRRAFAARAAGRARRDAPSFREALTMPHASGSTQAGTGAGSTGATLAVLGGSGLYELEGLTDVTELSVHTPYGAPSDAIVRGRLGDTTLLFLPRHGRGHRIAPHRINYRANVFALKQLGAEQILSVSAVGSLKETLHPGDFVLV